jgi:hypothetical protein
MWLERPPIRERYSSGSRFLSITLACTVTARPQPEITKWAVAVLSLNQVRKMVPRPHRGVAFEIWELVYGDDADCPVTDEDFLGKQTYVLADGSKVPSQQFRIRSLKVGNKAIENVVASIASVNATILLGQSFLSKFKSWSVDNEKHTLILR